MDAPGWTHRVLMAKPLSEQNEGKIIPQEIQSRIFEPFFEAKPVGKGTGLSLDAHAAHWRNRHRNNRPRIASGDDYHPPGHESLSIFCILVGL